MSQDHSFPPRTRNVVLVQKNTDVNRPREAEEFGPIYFCTEHELPISPFIFLWIKSNHTTTHQLNLQPSCSSLGPAPPKAPAHLFPRMLAVGDTHMGSPYSMPVELQRNPHRDCKAQASLAPQDQYTPHPPRHQRP